MWIVLSGVALAALAATWLGVMLWRLDQPCVPRGTWLRLGVALGLLAAAWGLLAWATGG